MQFYSAIYDYIKSNFVKNKLPTILKAIIDNKHNEVALAKASTSIKDIHETLKSAAPVRSFMRAIKSKIDQGESAVIAEIKKGSPSKGILRLSLIHI